MADRISQRRANTNAFFISVNTFLIAMVTLFGSNYSVFMIIAVTGIILACAWYFLLKSYRQLNSGKFKVLHEIEALLPISPYDIEWSKLELGKNKKLYWPISHLEVMLPAFIGFLYLVLLIYSLLGQISLPI